MSDKVGQPHFAYIAEVLPEPLLAVTAGGRILAANRAARFILASFGGLIGRDLSELAADGREALLEFLRFSSRSQERTIGTLSCLLNGKPESFRAEGFLLAPKAGDEPAIVLVRLLPKESSTGRFLLLNERIEQLSREVTARQSAENALREQHELLRVTLASIGDGVITTDSEGRITFQNQVSEALTGWPSDEATGRLLHEVFRIVDEESGEALEDPVSKVIRARQRIELANHTLLINKNLTERPIADSGAPILDGEGRLHGVVLVYRDVSQQKEIEKRREDLLESERAARTEAERAGRMKDEFLATLSHELRTPLNGILGYATLLQMGKHTDEERIEWVDAIAKSARVQAQLIEDLLDMNRIISGKIRLDVQLVDLAAVLEAAMETVKPSAEAKDLRIRKIVDPLAGVVRGDPSRLQQVIWNLLSNAVKFTPKGGRISVSLERVNSHVEITIADNGQGIPPEFLPHVFDRFRQADASISRHVGGLGLGLSIVKHIVELHGGQVRAKSRGEGHGATFVVALPVAVSRYESARELNEQAPASDLMNFDCVPDLAGLKILVVDDEPDACAFIARLLSECRAEVAMAHSAEEAWGTLNSQCVDVLVSDIGMPGVDGYSLMGRVRTVEGNEKLRSIPAVALTAFARPEDRRKAALAGFQVHLAKPIEAIEFLAVVASLAGRTGR